MEKAVTKLWTIQTAEAWKTLQKKKRLVGNWSRVWPEFVEAYKWLMDQMASRGIAVDPEQPPIWAWEFTAKPDLRRAAHLETGKQGVRLLLEVPSDLVLLSEFSGWHFVLNDHYIVADEKEEQDYWDNKNYDKYDPRRQESWQRIFKGSGHDMKMFADKPIFQAVFPYLDLAWVKSHQKFVAR